ncbi:deoxyribodipyrimidine photo-lyase [Saccharopolyspora erythraea]|uniref:cryptochrome/photolyase family protein n=1 Tax=Saccharopolyspora erythraea TaxID=1836 RepID=UPI001BA55F25|nr:deoxyribodipyrimidine photo-lyase [Saccharopolyspora erythraea]QUH02522.1 deoxyribodipyrimidine photo-lyase [Saccharopolyspora erythraea]
MTTVIALFTRDLRVHDNPMLAAAAEAERVVPLFVLDEEIWRSRFASARRTRFLDESLTDLDANLRELGARLVLRRGALVDEVCRIAEEVDAAEVHISADVSGYAMRRQARLAEALSAQRRELRCHDEVVTVVAPGRVTPGGADKDHFTVFTPYLRRWLETGKRPLAGEPRRLRLPSRLAIGPRPAGGSADKTWPGGETEGRRRADRWLGGGVRAYHERHDDLAADATSQLSPYLHFGCLSARELADRAGRGEGPEAFVRQLAWRDFHHQVLAARPEAVREDYRPHGDRWHRDAEALRAWKDGRTGIPIVDAGMRQLLEQGWMHNRARLVTGSFLTKSLYLDWRAGAWHFFDHLVDGDIANNCLNWQWVAGTGTDTRPNRVLNPLRQADRYDPGGDYVRRWVPELAGLGAGDVHRPWRLGDDELGRLGYPPPIVDLDQARERFLALRQR